MFAPAQCATHRTRPSNLERRRTILFYPHPRRRNRRERVRRSRRRARRGWQHRRGGNDWAGGDRRCGGAGDERDRGTTGLAGSTGASGTTGAAGTGGAAGRGGTSGTAGTTGLAGSTGAAGAAGTTGGGNGGSAAAGSTGAGGAAGTAPPADGAPTIVNDTFWKDTAGDHLFARGRRAAGRRHVLLVRRQVRRRGTYAATDGRQSTASRGSRRTLRRTSSTGSSRPSLNPANTGGWFGRLGVVYHAATKKYVLVAQGGGGLYFATADAPGRAVRLQQRADQSAGHRRRG